ncbi:MAG: hypothetical protein P4M15_03045 [Alphaproteobacteria bacterium]|nr:hypothetical protein [Alphaproteobacteria bacterium]
MARWLFTYAPPEGTILGNAGMSEAEIAQGRVDDLLAISGLARVLASLGNRRPRQPVSVYYLPVHALKLIDSGHAALAMPRKLRAVARELLRATRLKKGPKLPPAIRARNMTNGTYADETIRRYKWLERKQFEWLTAAARAESGDVTSRPLTPGTDAFQVLMVMAARRWLI